MDKLRCDKDVNVHGDIDIIVKISSCRFKSFVDISLIPSLKESSYGRIEVEDAIYSKEEINLLVKVFQKESNRDSVQYKLHQVDIIWAFYFDICRLVLSHNIFCSVVGQFLKMIKVQDTPLKRFCFGFTARHAETNGVYGFHDTLAYEYTEASLVMKKEGKIAEICFDCHVIS